MNNSGTAQVVSDNDDFEERMERIERKQLRRMEEYNKLTLEASIYYSDIRLFSVNDEFLQAKSHQFDTLEYLITTYTTKLDELNQQQIDLFYRLEHSWFCIAYCTHNHCLSSTDMFKTQPAWINPLEYKCLCLRAHTPCETFPVFTEQQLPDKYATTPNPEFYQLTRTLLDPTPFSADFAYQKMDLIEACHDLLQIISEAERKDHTLHEQMRVLRYPLLYISYNCTARRPLPPGVNVNDPIVQRGCVLHCHNNVYARFTSQRHWLDPFNYKCFCQHPTPPYSLPDRENAEVNRHPRLRYVHEQCILGSFPSTID